jgi:hypothetical protein
LALATTLTFASDIVLNDNAAFDPNPQDATLSSFTIHFAELPEPPRSRCSAPDSRQSFSRSGAA